MTEGSSCCTTTEANFLDVLSALPGHACSITEHVSTSWYQPKSLSVPLSWSCLTKTALEKHKLPKNTIILLCNQHVFIFIIRKTRPKFVTVFKVNSSSKQVHREYWSPSSPHHIGISQFTLMLLVSKLIFKGIALFLVWLVAVLFEQCPLWKLKWPKR